ncbi:Ig-like domain-containing protein, partial [Finegoldia sp. P2-F-LR]
MDKKNKNNIAKILLAFGVLASPMMLANQVSADNSIANTTNTNNVDATATAQSDAVTTENVIKENKEDKEQAKKEQAKEVVTTAAKNNKAEATEEATTTKDTAIETTETTSQKEEATEEKEEAVVEEKESFKLTDSQRQALKNANFTDGEIAKIEEDIANSLAEDSNLDVDAILNKKIQESNLLEVAPEEEKAPQKAGEGVDVHDKVHITNGKLEYADGGSNVNEVWVTSAGHAVFTSDFAADDGVKEGDYFTVDYGEYVLPGMINEPRSATDIVGVDGRLIAKAYYDRETNTSKYVFTNYLDDYKNVRGKFRQALWPVRETITDNKQKVPVSITVAGETITRDMVFDYGNKKDRPIIETIRSVNRYKDNNSISTTTYINQPNKKIYGKNYVKLESNNYKFTNPNQIKVYEVNDDGAFRDSFSPDLSKATEVKNLPVIINDDGTALIDVGINLAGKGPSVPAKRYIVLAEPTLKEGHATDKGVSFKSSVINQANGNPVIMDDGTVVSHSSTLTQSSHPSIGTGDLDPGQPAEEKGSFQEHHIYITKDEDGNIVEEKTITEDGKVKEGTKDETYPTGKIEKDGYKFVRTENPVNEPTYNKNGEPTEGNFKPGEKQEITYVYEKTITTKGSFQDHHIYQTVDKDGNVISEDATTDGDEQTGKENEEYTTNKIDKEGYKLVEVKPTNDKSKELGVKYDSENGEPTKGNYVAGEKQEVTYIYQRTKEEPGSFQEHHIYITKDEDGNIVEEKTITEDGKVKEGNKDETYPTGKIEKDGYKFVRTENPVNEPTYDKNGEPTEGNFKPGEKQEITYVYEKTITTKGSFQDHHIYQTVDKDGNVISEDATTDGDEQTGKENEEYTTNKIDKEGYKLVEVKPTNDKSKELGVKYDSENGEPTKGNYVAGEKQEVTYIYQRTKEEPTEEKGSFQEHHIYQTVDKNGKVISTDETKDKDVTEGTEKENYKTSKEDKDGYKLVKIESKNGGKFNEDGSEKEAAYIANTKQEVTYIYQRTKEEPTEEKGSFQEHHIYQTVDKNGKVISTDE